MIQLNKSRNFHSIVLISLLLAAFTGCATVKEIQAPEKKLHAFSSLSIKVTTQDEKASGQIKKFEKTLVATLVKSKSFKTVTVGDSGDLVLHVEITKYHPGNQAMRKVSGISNIMGGGGATLPGSETTMDVMGTFMEGGHPIGSFSTDGTSMRKNSTSVGGVNITAIKSLSDDLPLRTMNDVSEKISGYIHSKD